MSSKRNRKTLKEAVAPLSGSKPFRPLWAGLGVFVAAVAIRLLYIASIKGDPLFMTFILDSLVYDRWAAEILKGDWLSRGMGLLNLSPGYAYWLALVYAVFGHSLLANALLQFLIGGLVSVLVFLLSLELCGDGIVALVCGACYACYGPAVCYEAMPITAAWINMLNLSSLWILIRSRNCPSAGKSFAAGLLLGISYLFRPTVLLFGFCAVLLARRLFGPLESVWAKCLAAFVIGLALPLGMFGMRNLAAAGKMAFTVNTGGINFFIGNNRHATGTYMHFQDIESGNPLTQVDDYRRAAGRIAHRELSVDEAGGFWRKQAVRYIFSNPGEWLSLEARKLLRFFSPYEGAQNVSYYYFLERSSLLRLCSFLSYSFLCAFGLIGMSLALSGGAHAADRFTAIVLSAYWLAYLAACLLFFVTAEYRFAALPVVIVFMGAAFKAVRGWLRARSWSRSGCCAAAGVLLMLAFDLADAETSRSLRNHELSLAYTALGDALRQRGPADEAIRSYERAIELDPRSVLARINLGAALIDLQRCEDALPLFEEVVRLAPVWQAYSNLGRCHYQARRFPDAVRDFERAYQLEPSPRNKSNLDAARQRSKLP